MATFIEILKVVLPACITGLVTFLVTKYNYHKNIPLDKLEITYNRIYYPIYCLIRSSNEVSQVIEKSEKYLEKYSKYVDRSTEVAFKFLKDNPNSKKAYSNYKNNIYNTNSKLRRRLGYLEPNLLSMYTYSAPFEKRVFRITYELAFTYLFVIIIAINEVKQVDIVMLLIFFVVFLIFVIEAIVLIYESIKKLIKAVRRKR